MTDYISKITLDLNCNKSAPKISSAQYDKGRVIEISITADGANFDVNECTATLKGVRADKSYFALECTVNGNIVTACIDDTTLSVRGLTVAKVVLNDSERTYSTQNFIIDVDSGLEGDVTQSDDYSILNRLISQIHALNESGAILVDNEIDENSNNAVANSAVAKQLKLINVQKTENLLIIDDCKCEINGVKVTVKNNHIVVNGICSAGGGINLQTRLVKLYDEIYTLSTQNNTSTVTLNVSLANDDAIVSESISVNGTATKSITVTDVAFNQIRLYFIKDRVYENKEFDVQLEAGNTATAYVKPTAISRVNEILEIQKNIKNTNQISSELSTKVQDSSLKNELNSIPFAVIYNSPQQIAVPEIILSELVQDDISISRAKTAVFKNNNFFAVTYGENLNSDTADYPGTTGSGVLKISAKVFTINDSSISTIETVDIAQKGDNYIDYKGDEATFDGGCGLPCGVSDMQFFSSRVASEEKINGMSHTLIPCAVQITPSASGLIIGTIKELTLTIGTEKGRFNFHRLGYDDYYNYYTTNPPYHNYAKVDDWRWCQPVNDGFVYLTSNNGIDWIYQYTIKTIYKPYYEVACALINKQYIIYAARTNDNLLYVGKFNPETGNILCEYKVDDIGSRPLLVETGADVLLFHTILTNRRQAECLRLVNTSTNALTFYRWFSYYRNMTWYPAVCQDELYNSSISKIYIAGGNGTISYCQGISFSVLAVDNTKPISAAYAEFNIDGCYQNNREIIDEVAKIKTNMLKAVPLTQSEYDNLLEKDDNTLYLIVEDNIETSMLNAEVNDESETL